MQKVDLNFVIKDLEGKQINKPVLDSLGKAKENHSGDEPYTLKDLAVGGLQFDDMQSPKEEMQKLSDFKLALRLFEGGVQELDIDEMKRVKTAICKVYSTLFAGRACAILEGGDKIKKKA